MTFYYRTTTATSGDQQVSEKAIAFWEHASAKKNWRIVQLPNGYYQTELLLEDSILKTPLLELTYSSSSYCTKL